jgi:hypothetical protein
LASVTANASVSQKPVCERRTANMTNKQLLALIEATKIIAETEADKEKILANINRIQKQLKEKTVPSRHSTTVQK